MAENHGKGLLGQGVQVFILLAILTVLEFFFAVAIESAVLLIAVSIIKAGLVLYYYMHIYKLNAEDKNLDENSYDYKLVTNRLGLWLFLLSDAFVFGGLLVTRINLLEFTRPHLNQTVGLIVTVMLLISSFFMNRAETQMALGNRKGFMSGLLVTIVLGIAFLIGVVGVEWQLAAHEGLRATSGAAGAVFYMLTGMHAFHVLTGVIFLLVVYRNARNGHYSAEKHWAVEAAAVYWHFIDVVWIFFYPALYLIGNVI